MKMMMKKTISLILAVLMIASAFAAFSLFTSADETTVSIYGNGMENWGGSPNKGDEEAVTQILFCPEPWDADYYKAGLIVTINMKAVDGSSDDTFTATVATCYNGGTWGILRVEPCLMDTPWVPVKDLHYRATFTFVSMFGNTVKHTCASEYFLNVDPIVPDRTVVLPYGNGMENWVNSPNKDGEEAVTQILFRPEPWDSEHYVAGMEVIVNMKAVDGSSNDTFTTTVATRFNGGDWGLLRVEPCLMDTPWIPVKNKHYIAIFTFVNHKGKTVTVTATNAEGKTFEYYLNVDPIVPSNHIPTTQGGVITVRTIEDLWAVRNNLSGSYKLMKDIDLTDDIAPGGDWDNGYGWTPIGEDGDIPFTGTFDGNGHTINGLSIRESSNNNYIGLFGYINGGTVKNLNLTNVNIQSKSTSTGALAGCTKGARLSKIRVQGTLSSTPDAYDTVFGGLVGSMYNSTATNIAVNCALTSSNRHCGGIVGYIEYNVGGNVTTLSASYTTGMINYKGKDNVGGIVGESYAADLDRNGDKMTISDCYSCAIITATNSGAYVGGIAGQIKGGTYYLGYSQTTKQYYYDYYYSQILRCVSCGSLTKTGNSNNIGAIVGNNDYRSYVDECYYKSGVAATGVYNVNDTAATCVRLTAEQSKLMSCYGYLDFQNTWFVDLNSGVEHPQLKAVPESVLKNIVISSMPKTIYEQYVDEFSVEGGALRITYTNGHTQQLPMTEDMVSGFDNTVTGEQTLTVTYGKCQMTYTVTVYAHQHRYTSSVTAPTCTEYGYTTYTCACGYSYTDDLTPTGHSAVADAAVAPTCTETGLTAGSHCSVCGAVITAQRVIPAKGHTVVTDAAVAPTCTETGLSEGRHCSVCGTVINAQTTIPATGHSYVSAVTPPTFTEYGYTTYTCSVCGNSYIDSYVDPVSQVLCGDVNGDRAINKKDALALKKYLADSTYLIDLEAADVNGDGVINKKDSLRLKQYLADWDVVLGA